MDFEQTIFRVRKKTYIQYSFDMAQKECKAIEWSLNKLLNSWKKISILQRSGCRISSHLACRRREGVPEVFAAPSWTRIQDSYWTYQDILVVQLSVYWINFLKFYQESVMGKGKFMEWRFLLSWFKCSSSQQLLSLSCEQLLVAHDLPSRKKGWGNTLISDNFSSWLDFLFTSYII